VNAVMAEDGTLVYVPRGAVIGRTLVWVDRQGQETPIAAPPRVYNYPRLSPDGTRIALWSNDQESDLWLWDLGRATLTRVTSDPVLDAYPVWMPDSRRLLFSSDRAGARNLFAQAADGTGNAERLTENPNRQDATSVSPDGTRLVFSELAPATAFDVMQLPLDEARPSSGSVRTEFVAQRQAAPLVQTPSEERNGEVSPDGRWLAYEANDSGRFEIYVRPFPEVTRGRWQVSTGGGTRPLWARSGQEVFYLAPTGAVMRVAVASNLAWTATTPTQLFAGRYYAGSVAILGRTYDVSADGRRFLMIKPGAGIGVSDDATTAPTNLVVVQNWLEELKRLVPVN
jgi:serine/threonine-protein kinase